MIFHNKDKPENYIHNYYKVITFLETYKHTLNPTYDWHSWPKSDEGLMIPLELMNRRRDRKTLLKRMEIG